MSKPLFIFESVEAATLTASAGSATDYPTTNLQDHRYSTKWKSAATTMSQLLTAQYTTVKAIDTIVIANHNINSLGLTALHFRTSDNGSSWTERAEVTVFPDPLVIQITEVSHLYANLKFTKSSALSAAPELGLLFVGKRIELPLYLNQPQRGLECDAEVMEAMDGSRYASSQRSDRERFVLSWGNKKQVDEAEWYRLVRGVNGREKPFYFCDMDGNWHFVRFDKNYMPSSGVGNVTFKTAGVEMSAEQVGLAISLPGPYTVAAPV